MPTLPDLSALDLGPPTGPVVAYELPQRTQWDLIRNEAARQTRQRTRISNAGRDQCSVTLEELEDGEQVYEFPDSGVKVSLRGIYEYWVRRRARTPPLPPNNPCNPPEVVPLTEVVAVARALGFPNLGPGSIADPAPPPPPPRAPRTAPQNAPNDHERGSYLRSGGVVERMHGEDLIEAIQSRFASASGGAGGALMAEALPNMLRDAEGEALIRRHMAEAARDGERAEFGNIGDAVRYRWIVQETRSVVVPVGTPYQPELHQMTIDIRAPPGSLLAQQLYRLFLEDGGYRNNDAARPIGALTTQPVASMIARALSQALGHPAGWLARQLPEMFARNPDVPNLTQHAANAIDYWFVFPFTRGQQPALGDDVGTSYLSIRFPIWLLAMGTNLHAAEFTVPHFPSTRLPFGDPEFELTTEAEHTPMMRLVTVAHTAMQIFLGYLFARRPTSAVGFLAPVIQPVPTFDPQILGQVEGRMLRYVHRGYCQVAAVSASALDSAMYRLKHLVAATLSGDETPDWILDSEYPPVTPLSSMFSGRSGQRTRTGRAGGVREYRPERRVEISFREAGGREVRRVVAEMRVPTWIVQYTPGVVPRDDYEYVRDPLARRIGADQI